MVGLHRPVFGADGGALDQWQKIGLHAFAGDIGTTDALGAPANLVDLVEKHDAVVFDVADRLLDRRVVVDQLVGLFRHQDVEAVAHGNLARLGALTECLAEHLGEIDHADMASGHAWDLEGRHACAVVDDLNLDLAVVELAGAKPFAESIAGGESGIGADQSVDHALLGIELRLGLDLFALCVAHESDAGFQQIADDLIHVAADIADFGELRGFDLDEGRAGEPGQPPRDLGLADAGRPDHQDVLGQDLLAQLLVELLPAPAVAERNGDGALGVALTDDVAVELRDDLTRRKTGHALTTW